MCGLSLVNIWLDLTLYCVFFPLKLLLSWGHWWIQTLNRLSTKPWLGYSGCELCYHLKQVCYWGSLLEESCILKLRVLPTRFCLWGENFKYKHWAVITVILDESKFAEYELRKLWSKLLRNILRPKPVWTLTRV